MEFFILLRKNFKLVFDDKIYKKDHLNKKTSATAYKFMK